MKKFVLLVLICLSCLGFAGCVEDSPPPPAHTHNYVEHVAVSATCTTHGNELYYTCDGCSLVFNASKSEITEIPVVPAGHAFVDHFAVEATCTTDGNELYYTCENCSVIFDKNKQVTTAIPVIKASHSFVEHPAVEATCNTKGNELYYTCENCSAVFDQNKQVINAIPVINSQHSFSQQQVTTSDLFKYDLSVCNKCNDYVISVANGTISSAPYQQYASENMLQSFVGNAKQKELEAMYFEAVAKGLHFQFSQDVVLQSDVVFSIDYGSYGLSANQALAVWSAVESDYPIFYWLENTVNYDLAGGTNIYYLTNSDYYSWQQRSAFNDVVFDGIDQLASQAQNKTEFEKIKFLFDTIIDNTDYAYDSQNQPSTELKAHSILGYFSGQNVVCEGYAKTLQTLFNTLCIENCYVAGYAGEDHAWNYVNLFGEWYLIDATWSDTSVDNDVFLVNEFDNVADTYQPNDSTMSIKYQYQLPALSKVPFTLVSLHKGDQFVGNFGSVDSALNAFDNEKADYTIYLYDTQTNESYFSWKISDWFNSYPAALVSAHEISGANSVAIVGTENTNPQKPDMPYVFFGNDLVLKTDVIFKKVLFTRAMVGNTVFGDNVIDLAQQTMTFDNCIGDVFSPINGGNGSQIVYKNIKGYMSSDCLNQYGIVNIDTIVLDDADINFENDITLQKLVVDVGGEARFVNLNQDMLVALGLADGTIDVKIEKIEFYSDERGNSSGVNFESTKKYVINAEITDVVAEGGAVNPVDISFADFDYYPNVTFKNKIEGKVWIGINGSTEKIVNGQPIKTAINPLLYKGAFFNFKDFMNSSVAIVVVEENAGYDRTKYFKVEENGDVVANVTKEGDFILSGTTLVSYVGDDLFIEIPEGITEIAWAGIAEKDIIVITLPSTLEKIEDNFISGCYNLAEIVNKSALSNEQIVESLWGHLPNLKQVVSEQTVFNVDDFWFIEYDGEFYLISYTGDKIDLVLPDSKDITTLAGAKYIIGSNAFAENNSLQNVTISGSVKSVGEWAFSHCSALQKVVIEQGVEEILQSAFYSCQSLKEITISASVNNIGQGVFSWCRALEKITIDEANAVYESANSNCIIEKQTKTLIAGCNTTVIPTEIKHIAASAFSGSGIREVILPEGIETIGEYAFSACFNLKNVYYNGSAQQFYAMAEQSSILDFMQNLYIYDNGNWVKAN